MLYQLEMSSDSVETVLRSFFHSGVSDEDPELEPMAQRFAEQLFRGVVARREILDSLIVRGTEHWRIERMAAIDRNVLRLALYELLQKDGTPHAVILDEAIELAKAYGGEESGAFVNGLLDALRKRLESGELAP